jgi:hypothetical protein
MRFRLLFIALLFSPFAAPLPAAPPDPAALAAAIDAALMARDLPALCALVDTEGLSAEDLKKVGPGLAGLCRTSHASRVRSGRLPSSMIFGLLRRDLNCRPKRPLNGRIMRRNLLWFAES